MSQTQYSANVISQSTILTSSDLCGDAGQPFRVKNRLEDASKISTDKHTWTYTYRQTKTGRHTNRHADRHTSPYRHIETDTHKQARADINRRTCTQRHTQRHTEGVKELTQE